jgi:hypothetical protein
MPSAYIARLNREMQAKSPLQAGEPLTLHDRFVHWHKSLPEIARYRPFAMTELEQAVKRRSKGTPDRRRRGTPFSDNMMLVC